MRSLWQVLLVLILLSIPSWTSAQQFVQEFPTRTLPETRPQSIEPFEAGLRKQAEQGSAWASMSLFGMYFSRGSSSDKAEAAMWLRRAADQGLNIAQANVGANYYTGHGVPQDYAEAAKWYRKAADQGYLVAQHSLGKMYAKGEGVPQDYVAAYMWLSLPPPPSWGGFVDTDILKLKEEIAGRMTPQQILEAERLIKEWKPTATK